MMRIFFRNRRRNLRLGWKSVLLLVTIPFSMVILFSVHSGGLFELGDGVLNTGSGDILGSIQSGCDWADLFDATPTPDEFDAAAAACGGITAIFIADDLSAKKLVDDTIFASSNKNIDPTATWNWDTGNNPPKDDLSNVYSFATLDADDHLIIYLGLERLADEGDSHIDFEFNQALISLDKDPACGDDLTAGAGDKSPCEFLGNKTNNDLLLAMDFEKGGNLGIIRTFRWSDPDGIPGTGDESLVPLLDLGGEGCDAGDDLCAVNNGGVIDGGPWPNFNRHGALVTDLDPNAFTEIGLDVTALLGTTPCFGTIQAHTRTSQSVTSELKDFALGEFSICGLEVTKEGPDLSKIGDDVTYTYTIENTGGVELHLVSAIDDPVGDLSADATSNGCDPLGPGDSCTFDVVFTIPGSAEDPFENVITVTYNSESDFSGAELIDDDNHLVNLFQPAISFDKSADTGLSKIGDVINYTLTLVNESSADTPDMECTIMDALLSINESVTLSSGGDHVINVAYTVQAGDADPFVNNASASCSPVGFPNVLNAGDGVSVNLFQPSIGLEKTGDELSKVGDDVDYTITLSNTSSADSPDLECTITDALLGINTDVTLATGASHVINLSRTVLAGDPDPLPNTADASCSPIGFPNVFAANASHSVNLFQPSIGLDKNCGPTEVAPGESVNYTITLSNTSSADSPDLECTITDALLGINANVTLASGANHVINQSRAVQPSDPDPLVNTADVACSPIGFPNQLPASDSCEVDIVGCALSPGFWGGGDGVSKWNTFADPIAAAAGFTGGSDFDVNGDTIIDVDASLQALGINTYLEVLRLSSAGGDVTKQLSFKYIAARLNQAAFGVPSGIDTLLDQIAAYFVANSVGSDPQGAAFDAGKALKTALDGYFATVGEQFCPLPSEIPEA